MTSRHISDHGSILVIGEHHCGALQTTLVNRGVAGGVGTLLTQLAAGTGTAGVIGGNRRQARASFSEALGTTGKTLLIPGVR